MTQAVISKEKKRTRKVVVENALVLDAAILARKKVLSQPRTAWVLTYRTGEQVLGEFTLLVFESFVHLLYTIPVPGTTPMKANFKIELARTRCHFGHGHGRAWFLCPGGTKAKPCRRRCRKLFLPMDGRSFACRDCHGLGYTSNQKKGNALWERFLKPKLDLESAAADLGRFRSKEKRARAFHKFEATSKVLREFEEWTDETMARWASGNGPLRKKDYETMRQLAAADFQRPPIRVQIERAETWFERFVGQASAGKDETKPAPADRLGGEESQQHIEATPASPLPCSA